MRPRRLAELAESAEQALAAAAEEAEELGSDAIGAEHILLGLLRDERGASLFTTLGIPPAAAAERLKAGSRKGRRTAGADGAVTGPRQQTSHARRLLEVAAREAQARQSSMTADHLLLAALQEPRGTLARLLAESGVAPARARTELLNALAATDAVAVPPVVAPRVRKQREPKPRDPRPRAERAPERSERPVAPALTAAPEDVHRLLPPHLRPRPSAWGPLWRRVLLLAVPAAVAAEYLHASPVVVFIVSCAGVLPLAGYMSDATEHLSARSGPTIGGLLNATFGNAAELIIAIVALQAGYVELVKASITGSILGNLLLILGLSLVVGGARQAELRFNRTSVGMSATMLTAAVVGLVFPALFHATHTGPSRLTELRLSEGVAIVLAFTYALSLLFSLKTHKWLVAAEPHPSDSMPWSVGRSMLVLAMATAGVALMSEILVGATRGVTSALPVTETFLGLIVIPLIGNAAEHATAIMAARKGKIDLALQIALGSSTQIALLVAPILVFVGLFLGRDMNLVFTPFEVMAVGLATLITAISTLDGESHWFEGVQLLAVYAMVAVAAFFI